MAVKTSWSSGDVLTAADLTDTFAAKGDVAGETWTGTHDFTGATVTGAGSLALVGSAALSGASVSLNNVFTSTYENYRVEINFTNATATTYLVMRMRAAGADSPANLYAYGISEQQFGAATLTCRTFGTGQTEARVMYQTASNNRNTVSFDIHGPQTSTLTYWHPHGSTNDRSIFGSCALLNTVQFDGFSVYPSSGNFSSGNIRVYGYRNS